MTFAARTFQGSAGRGAIQYTFAANAANQTFNVTAGTAPPGGSVSGTYVAGVTDVTIVVNGGVYVYSTSTATPALALTGGSGGDVITLTNNGFIMGMGGTGGGSSGASTTALTPTAGGIALQAGFNLSVVKGAGSYIGGGGGGGGNGGSGGDADNISGGGGAGGGSAGTAYTGSVLIAAGAGGTPGNSGSNGTSSSPETATGGGGGRLFPGTGGVGGLCTGTVTTLDQGNGGTAGGGGASKNYGTATAAGGGGGFGAAGGSGNDWTTTTGAGAFDVTGGAGGSAGSVGANGAETKGLTLATTTAGAAGGKAINFNGFTVIISGSGTTYGATS